MKLSLVVKAANAEQAVEAAQAHGFENVMLAHLLPLWNQVVITADGTREEASAWLQEAFWAPAGQGYQVGTLLLYSDAPNLFRECCAPRGGGHSADDESFLQKSGDRA